MYIVMLVLVVIALGVLARHGKVELDYRKRFQLSGSEFSQLSWPSQQIMKLYNSLPAGNRPAGNIYSELRALDTQYEVDRVNQHFQEEYYKSDSYGYRTRAYRPGWDTGYSCRDYENKLRCGFREYHQIHDEIKSIKDALTTQEKALRVAAVQGNLDSARQLVETLRQERTIIEETTRELTYAGE